MYVAGMCHVMSMLGSAVACVYCLGFPTVMCFVVLLFFVFFFHVWFVFFLVFFHSLGRSWSLGLIFGSISFPFLFHIYYLWSS